MIVRALIQELLDCDMDVEVLTTSPVGEQCDLRGTATVIEPDGRKYVVIEATGVNEEDES